MKRKADNRILITFDFMIDLDVALFFLIKKKYNNPTLVDQTIMSINNREDLLSFLINRQPVNLLKVLIPDGDTVELYKSFMYDEDYEKELLDYAIPSDVFGLMVTFIKEASSVDVDILCRNELESNYIKKLNNTLNTVIYNDFKDVPLSNYTILYIKYIANLVSFRNVQGLHVYFADARYNMDEKFHNKPSGLYTSLYGDVNIFHTVSLYTDIKINRTYNRKD